MKKTTMAIKQKGFSLLELSIVIAVLGVLIYGAYLSQSSMRFFDTQKDNQMLIDNTRKVLQTFVQVNGFLPCPDTNGNGRENRDPSNLPQCIANTGTIPYLDLGISATDKWWTTLYYAVNQNVTTADINDSNTAASYFNNSTAPTPSFDFQTPPLGALDDRANNAFSPESTQANNWGNYVICREDSNSCSALTTPPNITEHSAIAVIVSFGDNAERTIAGNTATLNNAELENRNNFFTANDAYFWQTYDDQLFWITGYDMKYITIRSTRGLPDI